MWTTFISSEVVLYTRWVQTNTQAPFAIIPTVTGIKWLIRGLIVLS